MNYLLILQSYKTVLTVSLLFISINLCACEIQENTFDSSQGRVTLVFDKCHLRNPKLIINFNDVMEPMELRSHIMKLLTTFRLEFIRANLRPDLLLKELARIDHSKWKLGRLNSTFCFDKPQSNLVCKHFALLKYRVRPGKNRFRMIYNPSSVQ